MRRFLSQRQLPPPDAVRIEELLNYFDYDYPEPEGEHPFSATAEVGDAPWKPGHKLVHIGLQGKTLAPAEIPDRNLVFLLDVSGSMGQPNKLPLLVTAFTMLAEQLDERDRVSIVVYAGASGMVLAPTPGDQKETIITALKTLKPGGGTNAGQGIELAYSLAEQNFKKNAINRVILATDGDFNLGVTGGSLTRLIEQKRESGIYLTILGFGMYNLKDSHMEELSNKGNGNYAYIDSINEARKVLVEEASSTLVTIAKDVKIQVEFNPAKVAEYRLIGYENRLMKASDFKDDKKDAGEIGSGHTVTAIYEIVLGKADPAKAKVDPLKYQPAKDGSGGDSSGEGDGGEAAGSASGSSDELMTIKLRYKEPNASTSKATSFVITGEEAKAVKSSNNFRFSAAVAGFGMLLRGSPHKGSVTFAQVADLARGSTGEDRFGYRAEFLNLVGIAQSLSGESTSKSRATP